MSSRKIAIKYQVQGNKAVVRAMREIEGETGRAGRAAADASLKEKSFATALLERSNAADKALKKTEGLFAGSDRLLSIVGKVTGALGLGVAAYKLGSAAIEFFTKKQKRAAAAMRENTAAIKAQAAAMKRINAAQTGFLAGSGIDIRDVGADDARTGVRLQKEADRREEALKSAAEYAVRARDVQISQVNATKDELRLLERRARVSFFDSKAAKARIAAIKDERRHLAANAREAIRKQEELRDRAVESANALGSFRDDLAERMGMLDGDGLEAPATPAAPTGPRREREPTPNWLRQEIDLYVAGIERARQLHAALEALRPAWEAMVITPERVTAVASVMQEALTPLLPIADAATRAFDGVASSIAKAARAMADGQAASRVWNSELDRMASFGALAGEGIAGAAIDAIFFGESAQKMVGELAKAAARQAGVEALISTAKGITAATMGNPQAAGHFKAAATWAAVGVVAGAVGAATGGGGGGGGGRGALPPPTRRDLPRESGADGGLTINASIDLKSRPFATDRDVEAAMLRGVTNALQRAGGGGRAFRREISQ